MNDRRWVFPCLVFMFLMVAGFDCLAGQKTGADDSDRMSISESMATGQSINPAKSALQPASLASIFVVEPVFQFKPVLDGEAVTHLFTIKNTGMDQLKILKVRTG